MKTTSLAFAPYAARATAYHGNRNRAGHRLKVYSIGYGEEPIDLVSFEDGVERALEELPPAAPDEGPPGLGFLIAHRGKDLPTGSDRMGAR